MGKAQMANSYIKKLYSSQRLIQDHVTILKKELYIDTMYVWLWTLYAKKDLLYSPISKTLIILAL